ncbi:MAG: hypothetical protein R6W70_06380 [bacterium]
MRFISLFFTALLFFVCLSCESSRKDTEIIDSFFKLRKEGAVDEAWPMTDAGTREKISFRLFERYCFKNKVIRYDIKKSEDDFYVVTYSFYDKRFKKDGSELHTFYINSITEHIRVDRGKIIFPHPLFLKLREDIEADNLDSAKETINKMLDISPGQKDVISTGKRLGLI